MTRATLPEPASDEAVALLSPSSFPEFTMLELVAIIVVSAVALSFFSDATSGTAKMINAARRRGQVHVASKHY